MSVGEGFLEDVVRDASILARGRKGDPGWEFADGAGLDGSENVGCDGERVEVAVEGVVCGGTCAFKPPGASESDEMGLGEYSRGISSAAGIGRPLPAATN